MLLEMQRNTVRVEGGGWFCLVVAVSPEHNSNFVKLLKPFITLPTIIISM